MSADVIDSPGQSHSFDWSGSDPGAFVPARVAAQSYILDPLTLNAGTYALEVSVADDGLPVAVQLVGRTDDEPTLFSLAAQLESASPWPLVAPGG